jgi:hypothetical protein
MFKKILAVIAALFFSGYVLAESVPCKDAGALYFEKYGIKVPDGWKCSAVLDTKTKQPNKAYLWEKEGKSTIKLVALPMEMISPNPEEMNAWVDDPKEAEPDLSIRVFLNAFLGSQSYMTNNEREKLVNVYFNRPKAVFFSRGNKIITIYYNNTPRAWNPKKPLGIEKQKQRLLLFNTRDEDRSLFLSVSCDACLFDELFSFVVNPVLQREEF